MARTSRTSPRRNPYGHIKRSEGKRSGLEVAIAASLRSVGAEFEEEKDLDAIPYTNAKVKKYHPDFRLKNGIIIESKGWFKTADRTKHLCIKYQHPDLDIRFVFSNPNQKIGKKSNTTYAMWCDKHGFKYAKGTVPNEWIVEGCRHSNECFTHQSTRDNGTIYYFDQCQVCGHEKNSKAGGHDW